MEDSTPLAQLDARSPLHSRHRSWVRVVRWLNASLSFRSRHSSSTLLSFLCVFFSREGKRTAGRRSCGWGEWHRRIAGCGADCTAQQERAHQRRWPLRKHCCTGFTRKGLSYIKDRYRLKFCADAECSDTPDSEWSFSACAFQVCDFHFSPFRHFFALQR